MRSPSCPNPFTTTHQIPRSLRPSRTLNKTSQNEPGGLAVARDNRLTKSITYNLGIPKVRPLGNPGKPGKTHRYPDFYPTTQRTPGSAGVTNLSTNAMNRLVLLPVDPYLLYAYWELSAGLPPATGARPILRLHESPITSDSSRSSDIDIDLAAGNSYVHLWTPGRRYLAELGLRRPDGTLLILARSNSITTPLACPPPTPAMPLNLDAALPPEPAFHLDLPDVEPTPYTEAPFTPGISSPRGGEHGA